MSDQTYFTTRDTFDEWRAQEHNDRTWHAWAAGVHRAAFPRNRAAYSYSTRDFRDAERAGHAYAIHLLENGLKWKCSECGSEHERKEQGSG